MSGTSPMKKLDDTVYDTLASRGYAIVQAVTHYKDAKILAEVSKGLGEAMVGISAKSIPADQLMAPRSI